MADLGAGSQSLLLLSVVVVSPEPRRSGSSSATILTIGPWGFSAAEVARGRVAHEASERLLFYFLLGLAGLLAVVLRLLLLLLLLLRLLFSAGPLLMSLLFSEVILIVLSFSH